MRRILKFKDSWHARPTEPKLIELYQMPMRPIMVFVQCAFVSLFGVDRDRALNTIATYNRYFHRYLLLLRN